jgi:hypothetical protein
LFVSSQDWKARLKLPPADTRYRTEVLFWTIKSYSHIYIIQVIVYVKYALFWSYILFENLDL